MSDQVLLILSKAVFGGSILLIVYLVYREWKLTKIDAEKAEIALGEKENEDRVKNLDPNQLVDLVNDDTSSSGTENSPPTKKPTGSI